MAVDVTTEIVIHRPIADVAAYAGDPTNAPQWYTNIRTVEVKTPPPFGPGDADRVRCNAPLPHPVLHL